MKCDASLPVSTLDTRRDHQSHGRAGRRKLTLSFLLIASLAFSTYHLFLNTERLDGGQRNARAGRFHSPAQLASVQARCASLQLTPKSVPDTTRTKSERSVEGTKPLLIKNATIWTGRLDGEEIIYGGDVLLEDGVIQAVGRVGEGVIANIEGAEAEVLEAKGAWVTPGYAALLLNSEANLSCNQVLLICTLTSQSTRRLPFEEPTTAIRGTVLRSPGSAPSTDLTHMTMHTR